MAASITDPIPDGTGDSRRLADDRARGQRHVDKNPIRNLLDVDSVLDSIQDAIFLIDMDMRVVDANRQALDLLNCTLDDIRGRTCSEVVNCHACHHNCPFRRVTTDGQSERQFNIAMTLPSGEARRICLNSQPLRSRDGHIIGLAESVRDVGHLNNLFAELNSLNTHMAAEKNRVRAILDSIPVGVYTIDPDWRITSINRSAQEITGYSEAEAVGKYCYKILNSSICFTACPLKETLETGRERHDVEGVIRNRAGESRKLLFSTSVFRGPGEQISGGVESIRDLGLLQQLLEKLPAGRGLGRLVGTAEQMVRVFNLVEIVKDSDSTILLTGESGTGKNLVAQEVHARSKRHAAPFVKISCAALAETLLESELFGHVKGAFTGATQDKAGKFEAADGGTVFLDEIGEIPSQTQVKLLRFLQEQEFERVGDNNTIRVDVRIIAATNRDLRQMVREGQFREDLYYRLAVIPVHIPPLRQRREDLPALVVHILDKLARRLGQETKALSPDVMDLFRSYAWPGNIRELENVLEHGFVCSAGKIITTDSLPQHIREEPAGRPVPSTFPRRPDAGERDTILAALRQHDWHIQDTAAALGMNRTTLWRKMRKFDLHK